MSRQIVGARLAAVMRLEFSERGGEDGGEREFAGTREEEADREQKFGEGELHAAVADVVAVRQVDHENGAEHDDDDANGADTEQRSEKDGEAAGELSEADEIADDVRRLHEGGEVVRTGTAKGAEEDGGAVIEEGQSAGNTHDEKRKLGFGNRV